MFSCIAWYRKVSDSDKAYLQRSHLAQLKHEFDDPKDGRDGVHADNIRRPHKKQLDEAPANPSSILHLVESALFWRIRGA
jgi:hypothetical protein